MDRLYAFLDIETTGFHQETDKIIEIGAVIAKKGIIIDQYHTLVQHTGSLPLRITNLTGITANMLIDAPELEGVLADLAKFVLDLPIVGHNISFDMNFINYNARQKLNNSTLDTLDLLKFMLPHAESYRLESVKKALELENTGKNHRALVDAEIACQVLYKVFDMFKGLDYEVLSQMHQLTEGLTGELLPFLQAYITQCLKQFPQNKSGVPFAYMRGGEEPNKNLFSPETNDIKVKPADLGSISGMLEPGGMFAAVNPNYKYRPGQVEMLNTVMEGFSKGKHMVVEAGTGTGKSLAYLIPAIFWSLANESKVVIATHTINLQEQLWNKELPEIRNTTGAKFGAALVKGRTNYLCLRRWSDKLKNHASLEDNEIMFCLKVLVWLIYTEAGDRSELNMLPMQKQYWHEINSEADYCMGPDCHWFHKNCFVAKAKKLAEIADVLIVNHSLLLSDIKIQNKLLPAYNYLVIDEAHHLESSATEQLGWTVSINGLRSSLLSLTRNFGTGFGPGLLNQIKQVMRKNSGEFSEDQRAKLEDVINDTFDQVKKIHDCLDEMEHFLTLWAKMRGAENMEESFQTFRVKSQHTVEAGWMNLMTVKDNFVGRSKALLYSFNKFTAWYEGLEKIQQRHFQSMVKEVEFHKGFFSEVNENLNQFSGLPSANVYWVELNRGIRPDVRICSAPVSVSALLYENLFATKKSVLLTSATLSVDNNFDHLSNRIGLAFYTENDLIKKLIPSPFNYAEQSLLCVIRDLADPNGESGAEFTEGLVPVICDIATVLQGRTLVLFTSHRMLQEVYSKIQPHLERRGITVLGHKIDGGRTRLINEFKQNQNSVLFGTSSFWEGIDLPGEILKCVIIVRLPFSPPNSPVTEARIEELINEKKDAFYSYTVPEAVIKLKQGFGRLIRSENDEGVVIVLDKRMVDRKYGRKFLNSLPSRTHFRGDTPTVIQKVSDWLQGERLVFASTNVLENIKDLEKFIEQTKRKKK